MEVDFGRNDAERGGGRERGDTEEMRADGSVEGARRQGPQRQGHDEHDGHGGGARQQTGGPLPRRGRNSPAARADPPPYRYRSATARRAPRSGAGRLRASATGAR